MTKLLIIYAVGMFLGILIGWYLGILHMTKKASHGFCFRADDGEVYLRLSEEGQRRLADPDTRLLYLLVADISTRNKHLL